MIYGLYLSTQGAQVQSTRQDVIANNLANASTTAFKRDLALFQADHPYDVNRGSTSALSGGLDQSPGGISLAGIATVFRQGPLLKTGGAYDVALSGPGFLRVSDGQQELLTRNGQLTRNTQGELATQDSGHVVLGAGGSPIAIPDDVNQVEIAADGTVVQVGPGGTRSELGRLDIVTAESLDQLEKVGNSFYRTDSQVVSARNAVQVRQGYIEASGTQPVLEMRNLIEASRAFESNVNMIRTQDETLGQLLQTLGRK